MIHLIFYYINSTERLAYKSNEGVKYIHIPIYIYVLKNYNALVSM